MAFLSFARQYLAGWIWCRAWSSWQQKIYYPSSTDSNIKMKTKELIRKEIEVVPEPYLEEILDFIHFLKEKAAKKGMETTLLSESVLAREWLSPEEDEAWKNL